MMNSRLEELDVAKGIGIILVVLGHLEPGTYLMRFLYSFSLFLFFTCSGMLGVRYEKRNFLSILLSNCKRLLVPYFLFAVVSNAIDIAIGRIDVIQAGQNILFLNANVGWNAALWFLVALFWADSLCAVIIKLWKPLQVVVFITAIVLWNTFAELRLALPFGVYTVPVAMTFWLLGYWFRTYGFYDSLKNLNACNKLFYLGAWGGVFAINLIFGVILNSVISIYHVKYQNILFTFFAGVAGVLVVLELSTSIVAKGEKLAKYLKIYGRNTLLILCTHYFILRLIGEISIMLVGVNLWRYTSTVKSILFACAVMTFYFPILRYGKKF